MTLPFLASVAVVVLATSGEARAADLGADYDFIAAPAARAQPYDWAGLYAGGHAGYTWGDFKASGQGTIDAATFFQTNGADDYGSDGFVGGALVGYNLQRGRAVLGVEADLSWLGAKSEVESFAGTIGTVGFTVSAFDTIDWYGTVRARLGLAFDRLHVFVTGGLAFADTAPPIDFAFGGAGDPAVSAPGSEMRYGWAAGAGFEWAILDHLLLRGEWQIVDLGKATYAWSGSCTAGPPCTISATATDDLLINTARAALIFKFD